MKSIGNRTFEALDRQWLRTMTAYAQANRLEAITPVWAFAFFAYIDGDGDVDDPAYVRAVIDSILRGERTMTFRALQEVIRENQRLSPRMIHAPVGWRLHEERES